MPYIVVEDFKLGLDRRKSRSNGVPGSLWDIKNCHITRGGEIESRKRFVEKFTLPEGETFGLSAVRGQLYVFGEGSEPAGMPSGVTYQRLEHPTNSGMVRVLDEEAFDGKIYAVAEYADGAIYHYYNATRVSAWDTLAQEVADNTVIANYMASLIDLNSAVDAVSSSNIITITASQAGTPFTISAATTDFGGTDDQTITLEETQANVTDNEEVLATGSIEITGGTSAPGTNEISDLTINSVSIITNPVDWDTSNDQTASDLADEINNTDSSPNYTATVDGAVVTITAASGSGNTPNGFSVSATLGGDVTADTTDMSGGVNLETEVAQIYTATIGGTFEAEDLFQITINGQTYTVTGAAAGTGRTALTYKQKMYSLTESLAYFSALNNPLSWDRNSETEVGAGFINLSNQNEGSETLTVAAEYQNYVAFFAPNTIKIYNIDEDASLNTYIQNVNNTGTESPKSVVSYGNNDVFYYNASGVRSLKARDSSNAAYVSDVGTAIDTFIQAYAETLTEEQIQNAIGLHEPVDGRYWLCLGERIFVFSYFPGSKISAWSYYEPGFEIDAVAKVGKKIYVRAGDTIYLYGGDDGTDYPIADEAEYEIITPYLHANTPATFKTFTGFDAAIEGTWETWMLPDPANGNVQEAHGTFSETTFRLPRQKGELVSTHMAVRMTSTAGGRAVISNIAIHYQGTHEPG